jgi:hypothetical protein
MTPPSSTAAAAGTPANTTNSSIATILSPTYTSSTPTLITLPTELQLNLLTYLRANDLVYVQHVCKHFCNPVLIHKIVQHTAEHVYPPAWTAGFDQQPLTGTSERSKSSSSASAKSTTKRTSTISKTSLSSTSSSKSITFPTADDDADDIQDKYTFEHLRNM